jgi:transposase
MTTYSQELQDKMVAKLLHPDGPKVLQLSSETGISKTALYNWVNKYKQQSGKNMKKIINDKTNAISARPQNWSAVDKLNAIIETSSLSEEELGAYCRKKGIYSNNLDDWKLTIIDGLKPSANKQQKVEVVKLKSKVKSLESELTRKEKVLAETTALLVLKKKAHLIWGGEKDA